MKSIVFKSLAMLFIALSTTISVAATVILRPGEQQRIGNDLVVCQDDNGGGGGRRMHIFFAVARKGACGYNSTPQYCLATRSSQMERPECYAGYELLYSCTPGRNCPPWVRDESKCVSSPCGSGGKDECYR